jgi:catechol-2,3-dioxygenase
MSSKSTAIKALGEVNLRVRNLEKMTEFYTKVLGLEIIYKSNKHVFLKVANGYRGHTQVVALFNYRYEDDSDQKKRAAPEIEFTTLEHVAFNIELRSFQSEKKRLERIGLEINEEFHPEVHWRSMYFHDPEGNKIEFVSYDTSVK